MTLRILSMDRLSLSYGRVTMILFVVAAVVRLAHAQHENWIAGNPTHDQSQVDLNPAMPGIQPPHSKLVARPGAPKAQWVVDTDLAGATMAGLAANNGATMWWVFSQCFGGGFFDDLNALGGMQSMASAARHDELANYPLLCAFNGVRADWADSYADAITWAVEADAMSLLAGGRDPWGLINIMPESPGCNDPMMLAPWSGPTLLGWRGAEAANSEHPQFHSVGLNAEDMKFDDFQTSDRLAILWSGDPNWVDEWQIGLAIDRLLNSGFPGNNIYILFRNGKVPPDGAIKPHVMGPDALVPLGNLRIAEKCTLETIFSDHYGPQKSNPALLFFFANDHGANTGVGGGKSTPKTSYSSQTLPALPNDESGWVGLGGARGGGGCVLQPIGACCFNGSVCTLTSDTDCANLGGVFGGDEVACEEISCHLPCPADIAVPHDGVVNVTDLFILLANWATNGPGADLAPPLNIVNVSDLFTLLSQWGDCP